MTFGEGGVDVDGAAELSQLSITIAGPLIEPTQVERGLIAVGVQRELLLVFGDGARQIAALFGQQRQIEMREADVRFFGNRRANLPLRPDKVAAAQCEHAERVARRGEL